MSEIVTLEELKARETKTCGKGVVGQSSASRSCIRKVKAGTALPNGEDNAEK